MHFNVSAEFNFLSRQARLVLEIVAECSSVLVEFSLMRKYLWNMDYKNINEVVSIDATIWDLGMYEP